MKDIRIAAVQFEHIDGDVNANLKTIRTMTKLAVKQGAEVVSFHECSLTGYSFVQPFTGQELLSLAQLIPQGSAVQGLMDISEEFEVPLLAGLFEEHAGKVYNTYVCVQGRELKARFRKLHAFVNPYLQSGSEYVVFDLLDCRCGILICYDNNLIENVRMTTLLGAEIIFMPHVTGCLPSVMPGRGTVDPSLWENRKQDPVRLRQEFEGPKGRGWLMKWLPARAYENGIYAIFTNPIGMDYGQVRNGNSMILDPFGEVMSECHQLGNDLAIALCTNEKIKRSGGRRYLRARRPELYGKLVEPPEVPSATLPGWKLESKEESNKE